MIKIALAGIYSFASEPLSDDPIDDFIKKIKIFTYRVAIIVDNFFITKIIYNQ